MNQDLQNRINNLAKRKNISNEQLLESLITSEEEALAWLEQERNNTWQENSSDRSSWMLDNKNKIKDKVMGGRINPSIDKRYKI